MKKFTISLCLLFFLSLSLLTPFTVTAQITPTPSTVVGGPGILPGIDCGNSTAPENSPQRKCCPNQIQFPGSNAAGGNMIDDALKTVQTSPVFIAIPFVGGLLQTLTNIKDFVLQLKRNTSPIACPLGYPSTTDPNDTNCICLQTITPTPITALRDICGKYAFSNSGEQGECNACANAPGVWTGLGCIYGDTGEFLRGTVFRVAIGLAGVIALICIIYAAFTLQTSRGNPEKIKKAQELLTSCIMGLMLILFSVFILRLIGVNILKIPGFG